MSGIEGNVTENFWIEEGKKEGYNLKDRKVCIYL